MRPTITRRSPSRLRFRNGDKLRDDAPQVIGQTLPHRTRPATAPSSVAFPSPGTRPRDVFPRRRPQAACASCIFWKRSPSTHPDCSFPVSIDCQQRSAHVATRTFTKLYTSLTALDIRTAITDRPQLNPEGRVSKAPRNILLGRFAEGKVILAAISRRARPFHSIFYDYRIAKVLRLCLQDNYVLLSHLLSEAIEPGRAESLRKECDALLEDISIGGTG